MIPLNSLSSTTVKGQFTFPYNVVRTSLLEDYEMGGIALQDPSQGHQVQAWYARVDTATGNIYVRPVDSITETLIYNQSDVFEFAFAFDQNMRWLVICTLNTGETRLRWYNPTIPGYATVVFTGINSCRMTLDDSRELQIQQGSTDVILTYLRTADNKLCFRAQRERFLVEHELTTSASNQRITNFGMNRVLRMQWRLAARTFSERLPWL